MINRELIADFETYGEPVHIKFQNEVVIDDDRHVYFVKEGKIDLFSTSKDDGLVKRHYYFTLEQHMIVIGFPEEDLIRQFILRPNQPSSLIKLTFEQFELVSKKHKKEASNLISTWVEKLSSGLSKPIFPKPKKGIILDKEATFSIQNGDVLGTQHSVIWVKLNKGQLVYLGLDDIHESSRIYIPLSKNSWLQSVVSSEIYTLSTSNLIETNNLWPSLFSFYQLLFNCDMMNQSLHNIDELNELKYRQKNRHNFLRKGIHTLLNKINENHKESTVHFFSSDLLQKALTTVGQSQGFKISNQRGHLENSQTDFLTTINLSHVKTRLVLLRKNWWKNTTFPLLGFLKKNNRPVAFIKRIGSKQLVLKDFVRNVYLDIDEDVSNAVMPYAYMFFPPTSDIKFDWKFLIKSGLSSQKLSLAKLVSLILFSGLTLSIPPILLAFTFDFIIPNHHPFFLYQLGAIFIIVGVLNLLFSYSRNLICMKIISKIEYDSQSKVWDRILSLPLYIIRKRSAGELSVIGLNFQLLRKQLSGPSLHVLLSIFSASLCFLPLYILDPRLASIILLCFIFFTTLTVGIIVFNFSSVDQYFINKNTFSGLLIQIMSGIKKIKTSFSENRFYCKWASAYGYYLKKEDAVTDLTSLIKIQGIFFSTVSVILLFFMVSYFDHQVSAGVFIGFYFALFHFTNSITEMGSHLIDIYGLIPAINQTLDLVKNCPEDTVGLSDPGELHGTIEFSTIKFKYTPSEPSYILDNVSFHIENGEFVGIVGESGSGKSTLLKLILGFLKPESGSIYLDKMHIEKVNKQLLRRQIGTVLQEASLLPGNILSNIIGASSQTLEDAWNAAKIANIDHEINNLPMGMHTVITEGGSTFSSGQKQRLFIAKAVISKPRLLLFDEATSSLDNYSQSQITKSIETLNATRVVVAHRLTTIKHADRIIVLDKGKVVQEGTYDTLMADESGKFFDLAKRQLLG